jgi:hypothetical protein
MRCITCTSRVGARPKLGRWRVGRRATPAMSANRCLTTPISGHSCASGRTRSLDANGVIAADNLFQGIADGFEGDFDGWEAAAQP